MEDNKKNLEQGIISRSISKEMETSFIDYAMSVIVARAIPDARDGLKPVHRRILFAMHELEMFHNKPFKKSARVVGEVLAKYHPHGDSAAYESLVRMAQIFSMRYPLIWGQGNFGSIDGDSAAAMRYTEAKLQKISLQLLDDLNKDTVDFVDNYDGSEREPSVLPAKIPNLLINGSTGIAVGMATSIPPHNLTDVLQATIELAKNPEISIEELISIVKAPDFPTKGILINKTEIEESYKTGRGRAILRGRAHIDFDDSSNKGKITITEIPYAIEKSKLITKIVDLVKEKRLDSISNIKDESNREGIKISIFLKKGYLPEVELNKLYKLTQLQTNFPINMLALSKGRPKTLNLKTALEEFLLHQYDVLIRRTNFLLVKAKSRKHILEGLNIALENIDAVIQTIKESKDNKTAIENLMHKFKLSEEQSKAILDMKLQRLTGLERKTLIDEINELSKKINEYESLISSKQIQTEYLINQMEEVKNEFGDKRATQISSQDIGSIDDEELIPKKDVVITISRNGYAKRIEINEYRTQNRGGVGSKGATANEDDFIANILIANTHTDLLFFTSFGKVYRIRAHMIPEMSKVAKGIPVSNIINLEKNEVVKDILTLNDYDKKELVFVTEKGIVKKTDAEQFIRVNKNGKIAISLKDNDHLLGVHIVEKDNPEVELIIGNSNGKCVRFNVNDLRSMGRNTSGVRGINIADGKAIDFGTSQEGDKVLAISEKGYGKLTSIQEYRITNRGGKGVTTINTPKAGKLVALKVTKGNEDLLIITNKGTTIRTSLEDVSEFSRNTKGVKIINIKDNEKITSVALIKSEKEVAEEIEKTQELSLNIK